MSIDLLSNMSYTNKDFNSIYTELLEYASKLSYKWDPSTSDESDPGVVLLKLMAIIGDKDNYNIDKNILELMPASVTQLSAARQLFEQCGYTMPYYRSAIGVLQLTLNTEPELSADEVVPTGGYKYTIPRFTMFSDIDNSTVFTSLDNLVFSCPYNSAIKREKTLQTNVIQGTVKDYTVNNDSLITLSNLDYRNRLYFTETDIAENGIFISNTGNNFEDMDDWYRVDTLELEDPDTKCYRFGIDVDSNLCFIEFPTNISSKIGAGINIKYIRTNGATGNIAAKKITQLFTETKYQRSAITNSSEVVEIDVDATKLIISNPLPINNGYDPESIDDAYHNYKRVKNTFDTLVSLKDYTDHMITSEYASNGFICDRTNDIQHVYTLLTSEQYGNLVNKVIEPSSKRLYKLEDNTYKDINAPSLTAFDLCIYGLEYVSTVDTKSRYAQSFSMIPYGKETGQLSSATGYITYLNTDSIEKGIKCVQHDFNVEHDSNRILMIKNKYPINAKIMPQYKLSADQYTSVLDNISKALFLALNSKKVDFGAGASYDTIYTTILGSDARIKSVALDYPTYETYAVYKDTYGVYKEIRIDDNSYGGYIPVDISKTSTESLYKIGIDGPELVNITDAKASPNNTYYEYSETEGNLWNSFRAEIFAKSILAGTTPLYLQDDTFSIGLNQKNANNYKGISSVSTSTKFFGTITDNTWIMNRLIDQNENVVFTSPNYVKENQFSSYVKIIYDFPSLYNGKSDKLYKDNIYSFGKDSSGKDDFIVFFWKAKSEDEDYSYLKYSMSSETATSLASAISTSFSLPAKQPVPKNLATTIVGYDKTTQETWWSNIISHFRNNITTDGRIGTTNDSIDINNSNGLTETEVVTGLASSNDYNTLSGSQTIYTKNPNEIRLLDDETISDKFFWIVDKRDSNGNALLFEALKASDTSQSYTLKNGEYFIYTNPSMTSLNLLGSGTLITRTRKSGVDDTVELPELKCKVLDYSELLQNGPEAIEWETISNSQTNLIATEMQIVQIGAGNSLSIHNVTSGSFDELKVKDDVYYYYISEDAKKLNDSATISYGDGTASSELAAVPGGWSVQTILNIDMSSTKPQIFQSSATDKYGLKPESESIIWKYDQSLSWNIIQEDGTEGQETLSDSKSVLSSHELSLIGGTDLDVTSKTAIGSTPCEFLSYHLNVNNSEESTGETTQWTVSYPSNDFVCAVHIPTRNPSSEVTVTLAPMKVLPGNYLVSIYSDIPLSDTDKVELGFAGASAEYFYNSDSDKQKLLYKLSVTESCDLTITLKALVVKDTTFVIQEFYRYDDSIINDIRTAPCHNSDKLTNGQAENKNFEEKLVDKLLALDSNHKFNYLYHVEDSVLITNPLKSTTFLKSNHVYNPYTICQWDVDHIDTTLDILNNVR